LDRHFLLCNIYGPYYFMESFWNHFMSIHAIQLEDVIIGEDFNFSIGREEIWGDSTWEDSLSQFFLNKLELLGLMDVGQVTLIPT